MSYNNQHFVSRLIVSSGHGTCKDSKTLVCAYKQICEFRTEKKVLFQMCCNHANIKTLYIFMIVEIDLGMKSGHILAINSSDDIIKRL